MTAVAPKPAQKPAAKPGLHPRNRSLAGYDFAALTAIAPGLVKYVVSTAAGTPSIDFANPAAVVTTYLASPGAMAVRAAKS